MSLVILYVFILCIAAQPSETPASSPEPPISASATPVAAEATEGASVDSAAPQESTDPVAAPLPPPMPDAEPLRPTDDRKTIVRPEVVVRGATTGEATAAVGIGLWIPVGANDVSQPLTMIFSFDAGALLKEGRGNLLRDSSDKRLSGLAWSLGASIGVTGAYRAEDLFGKHVLYFAQPESEISATNQGIAQCRASCTPGSVDEGCDEFDKAVKEVGIIQRDEWFNRRVLLGTDTLSADEALERMQRIAPLRADKCAEPPEWRNLAQAWVAAPDAQRTAAKTELVEAFASWVQECSNSCSKARPRTASCAAAAGLSRELQVASAPDASRVPFDRSDLCKSGAEILQVAIDEDPRTRRLAAARYQAWKVAIGGGPVFAPFDFLQAQGKISVPDPTDPTSERRIDVDVLGDKSRLFFGGRLGASGAWLSLKGVTVEARFLYERAARPQTDQAKWCTASGIVGKTATDPRAEICQTRTFGRPGNTHETTLDAYVGYADMKRGLYRIGVGPRWAFRGPPQSDTDNGLTHTVGVRIPVSFNLLAVPRNNEKLDYDGLIRITPFFDRSWMWDDDPSKAGRWKKIYVGGVSLELLGRRSLFSTKYDEL